MNEILQNLDWSVLTDMLLSVIPALVCITLHELGHGYTALLLGDDTAKRMGRLTLNPLRHIDVMGLVMMALLRFGWAKPVPIDMRNFRRPKLGMAVTALAGPMTNVLIAVITMFLYGAAYPFFIRGSVGTYLLRMIYLTASLSVSLAIFNLIPIPPLDGSHVAENLLARYVPYKVWAFLHQYGRYILLALLWMGVLSYPISWAHDLVFSIISKLLVA